MEIVKIIGIALITIISTLLVRQVKAEFSIIVALTGGLIMLFMIIDGISDVIAYFSEIVVRTNINSEMFAIVLKIVGVGYLTEFSSHLCIDSGMSALADKLSLAGKIIIVVMSLPIITSLLDIVTEILKWKNFYY